MKQMKTLNGYEIVDKKAREDVDAHAKSFAALEDRVTMLEGGTGTGTIYFYDDLAAEVASYAEDDYDPFYIEVDGKKTDLTSSFFANKCTHIDFGGDAEESGAYLYFYEKSVKLAFYEIIDVCANGEWISGVGESYTYTAPEAVHITLHD